MCAPARRARLQACRGPLAGLAPGRGEARDGLRRERLLLPQLNLTEHALHIAVLLLALALRAR